MSSIYLPGPAGAVPIALSGSALKVDGLAPRLSAPSFAAMNTTVTNDLSPDGMNWDAQAGAFIVDQYGKYIQFDQRYNANTRLCYYVYSNDKGATWVDNSGIVGGEGFLTRGSIVYDTGRDCLHELCMTTNAGDGGIIYRRRAIARDGSNNITSITHAAGNPTGMDNAGAAYEFPTIVMSDSNTLIAAWTVRTAAPGGEIRCAKCDISANANAGATEANWVHIGVSSTTTIGGAPNVTSYTIPFTQGTANTPIYFSLKQMASGDLGWLYHSGPTPGQWRWRRSVKSATNVWNSLSTPVVVSDMQVAGVDTGYTFKNQLLSKLEEVSGVIFCAAPVWLSNTAGDTVRLFAISAADAVSAATVYSAGGAHAYAPTCALTYDATSGRLPVTYIKTGDSFPYVQTFDTALAQQQGELQLDTTICDIPLIVFARDGGKLGVAFRKQGAPPQSGRFGTLLWA